MATKGQEGRFEPQRTLLGRSGIPFQLAVERELRRIAPMHRFWVIGREVPWERGFLDLLLRSDDVYLGIETKRVEEQAWTFVVTDDESMRVTRCRLEWYNPRAPFRGVAYLQDSKIFCSEFVIVEPSPESDFCVIPKGGAVNILEQVASEVQAACRDILERGDLHHPEDHWEAIVPAIVTTARLIVCRVDPTAIELSTGQVNRDAATFQEVSFVRFRKTLVHERSNTYAEGPLRPEQWIADRQRTVLVIRPDALATVLSGFRAFHCQDTLGVHPREFTNPESIG